MPKDSGKIIRTPSMKAKLNQIKGMEPTEKALVNRIGNLIDFLVFEGRQESNPRTAGRKKSNSIPTPQNIQTTAIAGGFIVTWDPVDFSGLSFYELQIDSVSTFPSPSLFELIDTRFVFKESINSTQFVRVRSVSKRGEVSAFSSTSSVSGANSNSVVDSDQRSFENRTTVEPKPTLIGSDIDLLAGESIFVGVGGSFIGSPLTMEDRHRGFPTENNKKNEITFNLINSEDSCTSLEDGVVGIPDNFIETSSFYSLQVSGGNQAFYFNTFIYSNSFIDFFPIIELSEDTTSIDIEFLRYRISDDFYQPDYAQTGAILDASMAIIKL